MAEQIDRSVESMEIDRFLREDLGSRDLTASIIPENRMATASVVARESVVLCGQSWFTEVFRVLDPASEVVWNVSDGDLVDPDSEICRVEGKARALLSGERTALNLVQTLCSTATLSRRFHEAVRGTGAIVLDTRKTVPGLRQAQKYAVRCGGCSNHRFGLYDGILIKENHIVALGSIQSAIDTARAIYPQMFVEIEVESLSELGEAVRAGADRILLDNFHLDHLREAVRFTASAAALEASGNVTLTNIRDYAETGVDYISVGALTKNIEAADLSMRIAIG